MQAHSTRSSAQALYRVFVGPALSSLPPSRHLGQQALVANTCTTLPTPQQRQLHRRPFSTTTPLHTKTRAPVQRSQKWDEEITARLIQLVDPETGNLLDNGAPRTRWDVLNSLDPKTHRLVQLSPNPTPAEEERFRRGDVDGGANPRSGGYWDARAANGYGAFVPVCKVVSKKEQYDLERRKKAANKERVKEGSKAQSMKTLELNWAIDANDLQHRLDRIGEFLADGRRVEVVLAAKKRGRKATVQECGQVVKKIEECVTGVEGASVMKALTGKMGSFATIMLQGKVGKSQAHGVDLAQTEDPAEAKECVQSEAEMQVKLRPELPRRVL
ncbi:hypothetical protein LTR73_005496 [Friedmanniomyces endolithicus]|nr:hypothetical protein LTR73_005496 [Friedmanniomyces endolithicus]